MAAPAVAAATPGDDEALTYPPFCADAIRKVYSSETAHSGSFGAGHRCDGSQAMSQASVGLALSVRARILAIGNPVGPVSPDSVAVAASGVVRSTRRQYDMGVIDAPYYRRRRGSVMTGRVT